MNTIRLQVFLSRSGVASRRSSASIIRSGRVRVNGVTVTEPGYRVGDGVSVMMDGTVLTVEEEKIYLVLNKPYKVISATYDPEGRVTVQDIIEGSFPQRLFLVGRLDYLSTGLIFVTNDGKFANRLGHPRSGYVRKYEVRSKTDISRKMLQDWQQGVRVMGELYRLKDFYYVGAKSVVLSLTEGKNREIRNVFDHYGILVSALHRTQFGALRLGHLKPGKFRTLSNREISMLLDEQERVWPFQTMQRR